MFQQERSALSFHLPFITKHGDESQVGEWDNDPRPRLFMSAGQSSSLFWYNFKPWHTQKNPIHVPECKSWPLNFPHSAIRPLALPLATQGPLITQPGSSEWRQFSFLIVCYHLRAAIEPAVAFCIMDARRPIKCFIMKMDFYTNINLLEENLLPAFGRFL